MLVAPVLCGGAFLGLICFGSDFGGGFLHYSFYVAVIVLLRYVAGLGWVWNIAREAAARSAFDVYLNRAGRYEQSA